MSVMERREFITLLGGVASHPGPNVSGRALETEPLPHPRHRHGGPRLASRGLNAALVQRPCCRPMR
jgi:hypothetical protein